MKRVYFDVTDIVEYARHNPRVSGIQRVQARVISALGRSRSADQVRCTFCDERSGTVHVFNPSDVFQGHEFNSRRILYLLGQIEDPGRFPTQRAIKQYLQRFSDRKVLRGLKKLQVYATALLSPDRLSALGVEHSPLPRDLRPARIETIKALRPDEVFVFLGSNWTFPGALSFGKAHARQGGQVVQMIYDIIPHKTPEYCTSEQVTFFRRFLSQVPEYASKFLSISEWTRRDFLSFLADQGIERKVITVPLAHELDGFARNERSTPPTDRHLCDLKNQPFVLCVGTLECRKNGVSLLDAWARMLAEGHTPVPQLVFAGKIGWKTEPFFERLQCNPALQAKVTLLQTPSDQDLAFLYQNCMFTLYPSHYEGWGLPVGESAWFGKLTIASNATSLPEVCGDLVDYVDPADVNDIHTKILHALRHPEHVTRCEQRIRNAHLRTWDQVAGNIFDAIMDPA